MSKKKFSGLAWKHHVYNGTDDYKNYSGAGKGATIFTNYMKMINYLQEDGREWVVCLLKLDGQMLDFEYGNNYMATIPVFTPYYSPFEIIKL